jgi:hypothetical protein
VLSGFEKAPVFNRLIEIEESPMSKKMNLIGKTISGVVASCDGDGGRHRIWLLQFTDGTHVEFVSPSARRQLQRIAGRPRRRSGVTTNDPQLALNVA